MYISSKLYCFIVTYLHVSYIKKIEFFSHEEQEQAGHSLSCSVFVINFGEGFFAHYAEPCGAGGFWFECHRRLDIGLSQHCRNNNIEGHDNIVATIWWWQWQQWWQYIILDILLVFRVFVIFFTQFLQNCKHCQLQHHQICGDSSPDWGYLRFWNIIFEVGMCRGQNS